MRPATSSTAASSGGAWPAHGSPHRRPSLESWSPSSRPSALQSPPRDMPSSSHSSAGGRSGSVSALSSSPRGTSRDGPPAAPRGKKNGLVKSQYPRSSTDRHVEYVLVASFDIDRGSVMEHQYPGPVGGDEHMLAELMLPEGTHMRSQDWTIFFLHKDAATDDGDEEGGKEPKNRRRRRRRNGENGTLAEGEAEASDEDKDGDKSTEGESEESDTEEPLDGPPLVYVLNLVNTKQDNTVKRGAVVKAMAICTRHSFLHIYKPLLLLALEHYFANPVINTLARLYDAVNSMDLTLMPRLNPYERYILQYADAKDLFIEKFEAIVAQKMASKDSDHQDSDLPATSPGGQLPPGTRYGLPRDTHEFESVVRYANIPVPIKVPVALSPETVGDFSLIKLITTFSTPHSTSPVPFHPVHPHLTTGGPTTHPIIVLLNALLTQKRVIFLGHNLPSSQVAEAVLGACALVSGSVLRGFTRHAFPYTDLTKIDDLLKVPGFIAGVTNPVFNDQPQWWDLLCDLSSGRMRISTRVEQAPLTEGVLYFQQAGPTPLSSMGPAGGISAIAAAGASLSAGLGGNAVPHGSMAGDPTGDGAFMNSVLKAIEERRGENAVRAQFRNWVVKFTRIAAAFEETVYGASALHAQTSPKPPATPFAGADPQSPSVSSGSSAQGAMDGLELSPEVSGHGYVWPTAQLKTAELAANATRIEGWRNTRSYYNFVQDLTTSFIHRPIKNLDLQHLHAKLAKLRLGPEQSAKIYRAICTSTQTDLEISQLLSILEIGTWDPKGNPAASVNAGGQGTGLFYLAMGLFHPKADVRESVADFLTRIQEHEAGRHFWRGISRFDKSAWRRIMAAREAKMAAEEEEVVEVAK